MSSTLQCLHSVLELKSELIKYPGKTNDLDQSSHLLTIATRDLFGELDRNVKPVSLKQFWMMVCITYPPFSQRHNGALKQQDAEEFRTLIIYSLLWSLRTSHDSEYPEIVKKLFGIELVSRSHYEESGEESSERSEAESKFLLKCRISHEVNHLHEGLKHGLKSELKKVSPSLGRSSIYLKESRINNLPRYLTVQFVRFFWNRESHQTEMNLQKVDYPLELDVYELCSDELRKKLEAPRKLLRDEEGRKAGSKIDEKKPKETDVKMIDAEGSSSEIGETSTSSSHEGSTSKSEGQLTGVYELVSVLTHQGRSADSGHYVAWVKQESGKWIQFDDEEAILRCEEDITKLSGGGDWHTAYICMYKAPVIRN
ncbi:ubiquitin carboxyl-terminal hydrolase 6-like isoform X2 [Papaver somniferum]|uniref:ubiquitin carboxyl-terminal hydrolase 6-like isoform X2 n=1 Tax=Papaver somniferum TaxID=3469 RepID=UPI000E6F702B|nr:ubiquitin carboxyl-terminal hydrolase 6-like isoform X2 [Papaver somniferum]XP_026419346.1 ubiquitin carboxyl-terminal hydrolase 6-like isoform X2 [Papaver somniferum]XP_026419347.1 ubiquitin carboxyl-terminal hydrolase 6-like isoform X2 [Papaver somniferum]